jgi:hypothetical protein
MSIVTVLEKLYGSVSPETFENLYSDLVRGLQVQVNFVGTTNRGWIQLEVSGNDKTAAISLLDQEVGLAPLSADNLKKFSVIQGKVVFPNKSKDALYVDIGVFSPDNLEAVISKKHLCGQLADGKEVPLQELVRLFCFYDNMPLKVKIIEDEVEGNRNLKARLSKLQLSLFSRWVNFRLDRLVVLGSFFSDVERAVKLSKHFRDIIRIESLGALEHVILCKLGTDAVGLIPKLGRYIKGAVLIPFSPKKILEAFGNTYLDYELRLANF